MKRKLFVFFLALMTVLISSCASSYYQASDSLPADTTHSEIAVEDESYNRSNHKNPESRQRLIRNANLSLDVVDVAEASDSLNNIAGQLKGYISEANIYSISEERQAGRFVVRVPEPALDEALDAISALGQVKQKSFSEQDVTLQYIDLEARITNLEAQEDRFRDLLVEAQNIEDILAVEKELERVRGQLESLKGEFNYLKNRVNYATININMSEESPSTLLEPGTLSTGERLSQLFISNTNRMIRGLASTLVFAIGIIPILLPFILLGLGIWFLIKRRRRSK